MSTSPAEAAPSRAIRWFVWGFLTVFIASAIAGLELWPLTGFRLFSSARTEESITFAIETVDSNQIRRPFVIGDLPAGYSGFGSIMRTSMSPPQLQELCEIYRGAIRARDPLLDQIVLERVEQTLDPAGGSPTVERSDLARC